MTVVPPASHTTPHRSPRNEITARGGRTKETGHTFADLLHLRGRAALPAPDLQCTSHLPVLVELCAEQNRFRAEISIADNAVRFDARPIVAPAQVSHRHEGADAAANLQMATDTAASLQPLPGHRGYDHAVAAGQALAAAEDTGVRPPVAGQAPNRTEPPSGPLKPDAQASFGNSTVQSPDPRPTAAEKTRPAPSRLHPSESGAKNTPSSVVLLPNRVVVIVHGLSLSSAEREALLADVKDLLSKFGMADREVRIVANAGRSF